MLLKKYRHDHDIFALFVKKLTDLSIGKKKFCLQMFSSTVYSVSLSGKNYS